MPENNEPKALSPWVMRIFGWLAGAASFAAYLTQKDDWHSPPKTLLDGTFLWTALGLFLLPFFRSVKIGDLVSLERDIEKTKADVSAIRTELHQSISVLNANLSATTSIQNKVSNNFYGVQGQVDPDHALQATDSSQVAKPAAGSTNNPQPAGALGGSPQIGTARTAMEYKILNTLLLHQIIKFPESCYQIYISHPVARAHRS